MKNSLTLLLAVVLLSGTIPAGAGVIISEFMAVNNTTLADEDGAYSDWVELYNAGTNTVDLGGWYLANSATNLTHWQFPSTNLGPNQYLVVFASNKNRRVPGAPLHTNFKLSGSGEYLALVLPDGITKATEFAPVFPPQFADISYGNVMTGTVTTLVAPNAPARALVPAADIGSAWSQTNYNDSAWGSGTLGAGYDTSGSYASAIGLDLKSAMLYRNASAYVRVPFAVSAPAAFKLLTLSLRYDDGFVAYLNGTEVLRRNAPASPVWNSTATAAHGAPSPGSLAETFEGAGTNYTLTQYGTAPLPAVQPAGPNSTGRFLRLLYDGTNGAANAVAFRQTAPGLFERIVADFDFRISSSIKNPADGFAFMLIPAALYGTNGPGVNITSQAVEQPNYQGVFGVGFRVYPHISVNNVSAHWDGTKYADVPLPTSTLDLAAGVFHHAKVTLLHTNGGALATLTLTPDINGVPGTSFSAFSNVFIAGLNPFDCRVQFGGRTGGLNMALDLDNCSVQFVPPQGPIGFEDFNISSAINLLVPGQNVLALQGLTTSPGSSNFLLQPKLLAQDVIITQPPTYLYPPTPGEWNHSLGSTGVPAPVTFWPPAGVYTNDPLAVALTASSSSAMIYYTLDGSTPGTNSLVYSNALLVSTSAVIRAFATLNGMPGPVAAANYSLLDSSVTNFTSNLPLVIIDALGQTIPDGAKVGAYAVFIGTNSVTGRTSLLDPADYKGRLGIGLHGSSSLSFPKKTYTIELDDEAGSSLNYKLLGLPSGSDWLLYPSYDDKTFMNNVLTEELFESMGHYAIRRKYTEVFLHSNAGKVTSADYLGIFVLMERIRVDQNRVNIAKLSPSDNAPPAVTGGYLFSKDKVNPTDLTFTTSSGQQLILLSPAADAVTQPQWDYLTGYVNAFEAALYGANWRDPVRGYAAYIDADSFVDYHWIVEYSKNIDGVRISNYMNKDRNDKVRMEPIWDWDLSWGNANYADGAHTNNWYYTQLGAGDDIWLHQLRADPDFYQKIIDRWGALRLNVFNATNLLARIDQLTNYLWEAQARDFVAWPRLGTYVWPNPDGAAGGWDVDYVTPTTYAGIIAQFKKFVLGRYLWIEQQFVPAPSISTNGAVLSMAAPLGALYFTLDNTDPRAAGGGLSPSALLYNGPVTLTNNAGIFARAWYTNAWSPPARALYIAALPSLRISEIMYHPGVTSSNSIYGEKDYEFIELQNTGTNAIDLAGVSIGGGISYTFEPNQWRTLGTVTTNNFEGGPGMTRYSASTLGSAPGLSLTNDGPAGNMAVLLNSTTNTTRNRLSFDQTATSRCDRIVADFDFRARAAITGFTNGTPTTQNFDNPGTAYTLYSSVAAPVVLAADSGSTGNFLRLVPASGSQLGGIAFNRSATGAFNSVVATFDFRITPPSGGTPADGLGFALLSTAVYGTNGPGPAFGETPSLSASLGIGFDDYNNGSTPQEPNDNHISLHWNGAQIGNAAIPSFRMSNGRFHRAQLIIWFAANNAYVTVRLTPDINGTPGPTETVFQNTLISGVAPYQGRVAFGARTGGAWASHDIDNINVQFAQNLAPAAGLSFLLLPVAQFGATGPGSTLSTFTDWPLVPNALSFDLAFNPSNIVNDASLYWNATLLRSLPLPAGSFDLDAGVFHHARLQLDAASGGIYAAATLTPDALGIPGQPVNLFSNQYIPGAALSNTRLELAARNGGMLARVDLDNVRGVFQELAPLVLNPGESIVVVHNLAAFTSLYGAAIRVAGEFSGSLANQGDRLTLSGPLGEPLQDFTYAPSWYPATDGGGFSLVLADPNAPAGAGGLAADWRPSSALGGSPGATDPPPPPAILTASLPGSAAPLTLSWPAGSGSFRLYSAAALVPPGQWQLVTNAQVLAGDQWVVNWSSLTNAAVFFRLQQ